MSPLFQILLVALGSALGGLARWGLGLTAARWLGTRFPWGTLFINVSGCLVLGWFATLLAAGRAPDGGAVLAPDAWRLLVAVGFTGGYTTFSTFALESDKLLRDGEPRAALLDALCSLFLGLLATWPGMVLASP